MAESDLDLIIVGGGLAGLSAAVRGGELGLRVLVLEQGEGPIYPCNSRQSGGILHIGFHDPFRPAHELIDVMNRLSGGETDPVQAAALAEHARRLIRWLEEKGARFMRFNQQEGYRWCLAPPRALRAGLDWENRGPDVVLRKLASIIPTQGNELRLRTRVTDLFMEQGRCVGVRADTAGAPVELRARGVLLCDGGFQANRELYENNIGGDFEAIFQRGARTGRGSGLTMAARVGARLSRTDKFYGHLLCADAVRNDSVWPYPELDAIATAGLVVNEKGVRVADEGVAGVFLANALSQQPKGSTFFAIFDRAIWDGPGTSARIPANPLLEQAGGTVYRADTLSELATILGVPGDALAATVAERERALAEGRLASMPIPRSELVPPMPITGGPFMAIPLLPGITYTMGGIVVDAQAQVLDQHGAPIPGLFAAGATTGGLEGGSRAAYIGGLIKAGTFGLLAAERVARLTGRPASAPSPAAVSAPAQAASGRRRLARYPVLDATVRYGRPVIMVAAACLAVLLISLTWAPFGVAGAIGSLLVAGLVAVVGLGYIELIQVIVDFLMPSDGEAP